METITKDKYKYIEIETGKIKTLSEIKKELKELEQSTIEEEKDCLIFINDFLDEYLETYYIKTKYA